tara:strand:+ start:578 stop:838 length:261 start_codon:yes stop_codon:yes gene_type:complete
MDIENLTKNIKTKLLKNSFITNVKIEDKTYLHLKHASHDKNKFHIKLIIYSNYLKNLNKIESTKKINKVLENEIRDYIHSIQILIE